MVFELMGFKVAVTKIELCAVNFASQMDESCNVTLRRVQKVLRPSMMERNYCRLIVQEVYSVDSDGCGNINYVP